MQPTTDGFSLFNQNYILEQNPEGSVVISGNSAQIFNYALPIIKIGHHIHFLQLKANDNIEVVGLSSPNLSGKEVNFRGFTIVAKQYMENGGTVWHVEKQSNNLSTP